MKETTAISLINEFKPSKLDGKKATSIWTIYIMDTHPIRNTRTKDPTFDNNEGKTRWSIHPQVVHLSVKTSHGWVNKKSYNKIESAYLVMVNAAKTLGLPVESKWREFLDSKKEKDNENQIKKKEKELDETCNKYAFAIASSLNYKLFFEAMRDSEKSKLLLRAIEDISKEIRNDVINKKNIATERFSLTKNRIPIGLMFMSDKRMFTWEEELYGKIYTIELNSLGDKCMSLSIGSTNSIMTPTVNYSPSYDFRKKEGDAFLQGMICYDQKSGHMIGVVKNIMTSKDGSRGGLTVAKIWCDVMKKLGIEKWIGDYVTEGGERFIEALVKNGRVKVIGKQGSKYLLSC